MFYPAYDAYPEYNGFGHPFYGDPFGASRAAQSRVHPARLALARQAAERQRLELARQQEEERARRAALAKQREAALAKQRKKFLRAAHAAATRIAAVWRGHQARIAAQTLREEVAATDKLIEAELNEIEAAIAKIEAEHEVMAHESRSEKTARIASELFMRELLRVDGLELPPRAVEARAQRRALVRALNARIEKLEALADELKASSTPSPSSPEHEMAPVAEGADEQDEGSEGEGEGDIQMVDAPASAEHEGEDELADAIPSSPAHWAEVPASDVELTLLRKMVAELEEQNAQLRAHLEAAHQENHSLR